MADIGSSNVTYSLTRSLKTEDGRRVNHMTLTFGNGALTYPALGIPLTLGGLGMPTTVEKLVVIDDGATGYNVTVDLANLKLRLFQQSARTHAHDLLVKGGQAGSTTNDIAHYATDILGKEAATDATIAKAASATKGGVMSETLAAAVLVELGNVAVAAQTFKIEVVGW